MFWPKKWFFKVSNNWEGFPESVKLFQFAFYFNDLTTLTVTIPQIHMTIISLSFEFWRVCTLILVLNLDGLKPLSLMNSIHRFSLYNPLQYHLSITSDKGLHNVSSTCHSEGRTHLLLCQLGNLLDLQYNQRNTNVNTL